MRAPADARTPSMAARRGQVMQDSSTADMIFSVRQIIAWLSKDTRLLPGTVILTGAQPAPNLRTVALQHVRCLAPCLALPGLRRMPCVPPPRPADLPGTPEGVGMAREPPVWLTDGDVVTIDIEGIGRLTNPVLSKPKL
eukprot:SAG11_NODE_3537_length_2386_cov_1.154351_3_plen_139_part_00